MEKEEFAIISDRFLDKAYGKSKEQIVYMYLNDKQFKADYEAVKQHLIDVFVPILKEIYECVRSAVESISQSLGAEMKANPHFAKTIQVNSGLDMFKSVAQ